MKTMKLAAAGALCALAAAGCGAAAAGTTAGPVTSATTNAGQAASTACTQQVQRWLASPLGNGVTVKSAITGINFDAGLYVRHPDQADLGLIGDMVGQLTQLRTGQAVLLAGIPDCADPAGLLGQGLPDGTYLADADDMSQDATQPAAIADAHAMQKTFQRLTQELARTAPGAQL